MPASHLAIRHHRLDLKCRRTIHTGRLHFIHCRCNLCDTHCHFFFRDPLHIRSKMISWYLLYLFSGIEECRRRKSPHRITGHSQRIGNISPHGSLSIGSGNMYDPQLLLRVPHELCQLHDTIHGVITCQFFSYFFNKFYWFLIVHTDPAFLSQPADFEPQAQSQELLRNSHWLYTTLRSFSHPLKKDSGKKVKTPFT